MTVTLIRMIYATFQGTQKLLKGKDGAENQHGSVIQLSMKSGLAELRNKLKPKLVIGNINIKSLSNMFQRLKAIFKNKVAI